MCHFITAVLPRKANLKLADEIARRHHRQMAPLANASIEEQLRKDEAYFCTTSPKAMCDCGTCLGWFVSQNKRRAGPMDAAAETARLRRKKWSDTKIERWLEQKKADADSWLRNDAEDLENSKLVDDWFELLSELLQSRATPYVGLLLHLYSGSLGARLILKGRTESRISKLGRTTLASMEEDVLYVFRA